MTDRPAHAKTPGLIAWVKDVVDLYFAPWGAAKAARFEALTGDKPFDPEVVLKLIHEKLAALAPGNAGAVEAGLRWRHKIRGTTYRVLFEAAKAQSSIVALEDMTMVVYQGEADGLVWVRPALEFFDGRFERLPASPPATQRDGE